MHAQSKKQKQQIHPKEGAALVLEVEVWNELKIIQVEHCHIAQRRAKGTAGVQQALVETLRRTKQRRNEDNQSPAHHMNSQTPFVDI